MSTFDLTIAAGAKGCLVDTSIWIEVLRSRDRQRPHPIMPIVEQLSEADFICVSRLVVAEIVAGARSKSEAERLEQDFEGYRLCTDDISLFKEAAYLRQAYVRSFRRKPNPGLIDCYLVNLALREGLIIFTADGPLRSVAEFKGVKGIFFSIASSHLSYIA